jgi:hypothetical protein
MAYIEIYRRLSPFLALAVLPLLILLMVQKGETRHWHKQSGQFEQLYHDEQAAHQLTELNYRRAAEQARLADKANVDRVVAEQTHISKEQSLLPKHYAPDARATLGASRRCRPTTYRRAKSSA